MLLAACGGTATSGTFKPAPANTSSTAPASPTTSPPSTASKLADGILWPPFGPKTHISMPAYKPKDKALRPAVVAAQDFLLALLYSEYTGGRDTRWKSYIYGKDRSLMVAAMAKPDVTTESFVGTERMSHLHAARTSADEVEVSECIDVAGIRNTDLATGAVLPAADQYNSRDDYSYNTDVVAKLHGRWRVVLLEPPIYDAAECKP